MKRLAYDVNKWATMLKHWTCNDPLPSERDTPAMKWEDEVFCRIYDGEQPDLLPDDPSVDPKWGKWSRKFHRMAEQTPDFSILQKDCQGDLLRSVAATDAIYNALKDIVEKEDPNDGQGNGQGEGEGEGEGQGGAGDQALRDKIQQALRDAQQKADDASDMADAFGPQAGTGLGNPSGQLPKEKVQAWMKMLRDHPQLKKIAALAGRFRRIAHATRKTAVKHAADEVQDIELGSDISRMLPQEAVRSKGQHGTRLAFLADLAQSRLMQYRIGGTDAKGMGPVIVALDKSGSMNGAPDMWATAVALAIMSLAAKDRRPFVLLPFTGGIRGEWTVQPGEDIPLEALLVTASGGTDIDNALNRALGIIEKAQTDRSNLRKADIVVITDGDCYSESKVLERAEALNCKIVGVGIGCGTDMLKPWTHQAVGITDVSKGVTDEIAQALFSERL